MTRAQASLIPITGLPRAELAQLLVDGGLNGAQCAKVWRALYVDGVRHLSDIPGLGRPALRYLEGRFSLSRPAISTVETSEDETRKWLLRYPDAVEIESVFIPNQAQGALCVSSQVGCTLACAFCHTGTQDLVRNLRADEIVAQLLTAKDVYADWGTPRDRRKVSNLVMMGMGEPLYNYPAVAKALSIIMDGDGLALSKRRIVLSTSGVVPLIDRCGQELGVELAISLHAVRDELRDVLVPINKRWPIAELLNAVRAYPTLRNTRRILFEYVMLDGINDSDADARELVRLLQGIPAKVNLIPFNPWPGSNYTCSSWERIQAFSEIVRQGKIGCPVRKPRGRDISAACGQLKSETQRQRHAG